MSVTPSRKRARNPQPSFDAVRIAAENTKRLKVIHDAAAGVANAMDRAVGEIKRLPAIDTVAGAEAQLEDIITHSERAGQDIKQVIDQCTAVLAAGAIVRQANRNIHSEWRASTPILSLTSHGGLTSGKVEWKTGLCTAGYTVDVICQDKSGRTRFRLSAMATPQKRKPVPVAVQSFDITPEMYKYIRVAGVDSHLFLRLNSPSGSGVTGVTSDSRSVAIVV